MGCPYTWFRSLLDRKSSPKPNKDGLVEAQCLRVTVEKSGQKTVDVFLPARSARWLMDLIPADVMTKIRAEKIPIEEMNHELSQRKVLYPEELFSVADETRKVEVWLE